MPACTEYDILQVTGSNTELDGLYYKYADIWFTTDRTAWTRIPEVEPLSVLNGNPSIVYSFSEGWTIFFGYFPYYTVTSNAICPVNLTLNKFFFNDIPGAANTALITAYTPPPSDPITLRNAKYATATEAGSARFRRLVALGYV